MKGTMLVAAGLALALHPANAQDATAGKRVFNKCVACHSVGPNATNKVGPELNGLFGRPAGSVQGYAYSEANKKSGVTWTEDEFAKYIRDPQGTIKGTKMSFAGLKNDQEIADVTAYLRGFDAKGQTK